MEAVRKVNLSVIQIETDKRTIEKIDNTLTEEIIIGICSPIGCLKESVIASLKKRLIEYKYEVEIIKLSDFITTYKKVEDETFSGKTDSYNRLINKINGGNELRINYSPSILAELAIKKIFIDRVGKYTTADNLPDITDLKTRRKCYIIDSLKNLEELQLLRTVYRDIFYFFSIFSPFEERKENLLKKSLSLPEIDEIISTDKYQNNSSGQNVRDVFIEADFFVRASNFALKDIDSKVERYLHLIFNSKIITPFNNEIAMYQAKSAAGNSSCLSRQVGAAITDENGLILSKGWNDVPKFGGNLYNEDYIDDKRCFNLGYCSNDKTKDKLTDSIIEGLLNDEEIKQNLFGNKTWEKDDEEIKNLFKIIRKSTKVNDLIEFSRSVHAEMHAIITGSQLSGSKMINGKLFCTTYPCHNCARHIIVAGIKEVYYIEPYVKSLCLELHSDAITEDELEVDKVKLLVFDGVAPRRFLEFFTMSDNRKDKTGEIKVIDIETISPKTRLSLQALPTLEAQAIHSLEKFGLNE